MLRCPELRAQPGKERGLLRRSALLPPPVAPRKQASAGRWAFWPHLLESKPRTESSGPKFPWDAVREHPAPGTWTHRQRPKLDKRPGRGQTHLKVPDKENDPLQRGISLQWECQLPVANAPRSMLPEQPYWTQTHQAGSPPVVREASEPVAPCISFLRQKMSCI